MCQRTENPLHDMKYTETWLGSIDFKRVEAATGVVPNKGGRYQKYSDAEHYKIGKYGSEMGATAAVMRFKKDFPTMNERTIREMKKRYEELLKTKINVPQIIPKYRVPGRPGRPLLLGDLAQIVQSYIKGLCARECHISYLLAEATAKALIEYDIPK